MWDRWEPAVNLGCIINTDAYGGGPSYFEDPENGLITLYFTSERSGGLGGQDVYASLLRRDGSFGSAAVVWELSSAENDRAPEAQQDGLEISVETHGRGRFGDADLTACCRSRLSKGSIANAFC